MKYPYYASLYASCLLAGRMQIPLAQIMPVLLPLQLG